MKCGDLVRFPNGKKAHRVESQMAGIWTFCGLAIWEKELGNGEGLPLCKACERLWQKYLAWSMWPR